MLDALLPQTSSLRRQLRFASRKLNLGVRSRLRRNFTEPTAEGAAEFAKLLKTVYFPSWYSGMDMREFLASPEGDHATRMHTFIRLEMDRYEVVPWLDEVLRLNGARILEVGCGTGCGTVAFAEQGAKVTALDVHAEALLLAEKRCRMHGLRNVTFLRANAEDLAQLFGSGQFDMIIFFAVLEHMTLAERDAALKAAWSLLEPLQYLCLIETPNRLWPFDSHTSQLPFFNWLPDELAFRFVQRSPIPSHRHRFREITEANMLSFRREGRGVSFHDLDLALGECYEVVGDLMAFLTARNPTRLAKRVITRDGAKERFLNSYAPERHRAFFRQSLDLIIRKPVLTARLVLRDRSEHDTTPPRWHRASPTLTMRQGYQSGNVPSR